LGIFSKFRGAMTNIFLFAVNNRLTTTTTPRTPPPLPQPEIYIQITEPKIEIVEIGNTVTLHCAASSRRSQVKYYLFLIL